MDRKISGWTKASVLIGGAAFGLSAITAGVALWIWVIDARVDAKLLPMRQSLARIEAALGIPEKSAVNVVKRFPGN